MQNNFLQCPCGGFLPVDTIRTSIKCSCRRSGAMQHAWIMHQGYWWNSWSMNFCNPLEGPICLCLLWEQKHSGGLLPLRKIFCDFLPSPTLWSWECKDLYCRVLPTFTSELSPGSPQRDSCTPHLWYQLSSHLLGLVETGFSSSRLQELGRLAGWDAKNSTVGHITQNPPVSCTLCLGGGWRGERTQLLPLNCCRWCGLRFLLLPYLRLHLGQKAKWLWSLWTTAMMEKRLSSGGSDLKVINQE